MKRKIIKLFNKLKYKKNLPHGSQCCYVKLNNKYGIKIFYTVPAPKRNRNNTFNRQIKYHELGLSPKPYFKFEYIHKHNNYPLKKNKKYYCYVTEHVKEPTNYYYKKHINRLRYKLKKNNIPTFDTSIYNCGKKNNELILIDCDDFSNYEQDNWPYGR